jgi:hypothetical protein
MKTPDDKKENTSASAHLRDYSKKQKKYIYRKSIQLRNFKLLRGEGQLSRLSCMKVTLLLIQRYKLMGKSKI